MKAVVAELKQERRRLAKELAIVDSMLDKAGANGRPRRRRKSARKALGRGIVTGSQIKKDVAAAAKRGKKKKEPVPAEDAALAAKRARAEELRRSSEAAS